MMSRPRRDTEVGLLGGALNSPTKRRVGIPLPGHVPHSLVNPCDRGFGAGDCRSADSRQGPSGHAQAGHRPTDSYSCRATEAQRWSGHWRRRTSAMAAERVHQLKRPYFVSFRTRSISYSASFIAAARLIGVTPDLCLPSPSLTSHRQPPPSVN